MRLRISRLALFLEITVGLVFIFGALFVRTVSAAAPAVVTLVVPTASDQQVSLTWTNPAEGDFTGTMVRFSTTAFPTDTSDGTLVSDVVGTPSGTSSVAHSSLTNGTTYYYSLFSHNGSAEYSAAVNTQQLVMAASFTEDFEALTIADIDGQNGWDAIGGSWSVVDNSGDQTMKSSTANVAFETCRVINGGTVATYSNQMVRVDWKGSTTATPGQVFLRAQSASADAGGYFMWQASGTVRINYKSVSGASNTMLTSAAFTPIAGTWYTYEFSVVNNSAGLPVLTGYVWARGAAKPSTPTVQATDAFPRHAQGVFSLGKTGTSAAEYDNVTYYGMMGDSLATATPGDDSVVLAWTNPTAASYTGTMVRSSTSTFPTSTTDGTLVSSVTGSSGGTSTVTDSGLTDGTTYYYALFPYDSSGVYGTPLYLKQVAYPALFTENFTALSASTLAGQNAWTSPGGTWNVAALSSNNAATATSTTTYPTNKVINGINDATNQIFVTRFRSTLASNSTGFIWLRQQPHAEQGYLVWHNGNAWTISYLASGSLTNLGAAATTAAPAMEASTWFNLEASIIDNGSVLPVISVYVWKEGMEKPTTPTITATDSVNRYTKGFFALGKNTSAETGYYDDVGFYGAAPGVSITSPISAVAAATDVATITIVDDDDTIFVPYIQTSTTLSVTAAAGTTVAAGGGVEFILNEGLATEQTVIDLTAPYSASFSSLAKAEYTLDAYLLQADGSTHVVGDTYHDERTSIGVGDIITVIGDSITEGTLGTIDGGTVNSWLDGDAGTVSADNRNFPQHGFTNDSYKESFLSDMNDKLTAYYDYPVFLMNEGRSGIKASDYVSTQITAAWTARQAALDANKWLIHLGVNDATAGDSATTYETNMTSLINTLITTHGASASGIYLAHPTYRAGYTTELSGYITKIDDMRTDLGLAGGPNYYDTFENYVGTEYADTTHPNATGYVRMARLAALSMTQPTIASATVAQRLVTLVWDDMSVDEPTVAGYRVNYGTDAANLTSSATSTTNSTIVSGLTANTNYYFNVEAYDNDAFDISYSDLSAATSALHTSAGSTTVAGPSTVGEDTSTSVPDESVDETEPIPDGTEEENVPTEPIASPLVLPAGSGPSPVTGEQEATSTVTAGDYILS
ncbi:MAG: hypothetical protein NUV56_01640, partial [Candidatus Uhrbacteria bacterium]|nr:hypothetical protein [Candidatus Uhrbacteria bacterium]